MLREEHGFDSALVANRAMGATSSCMGLIQLHASGVHRAVDVLLVEYAINDTGTYRGEAELLERCMECFEGIVRRSLAHNPDLIVCTVLLTGRGTRHRRDLRPVADGMRALSEHYGAQVIDVAGALTPDMFEDDRLWADDFHPSTPEGVAFVGRHVAAGVAAALNAHKRRPLPAPFAPGQLADVGYTDDVAALLVRGAAQHRRYANSAVDVIATRLDPGAELGFKVDGELIALHHVAEHSSGVLRVVLGGQEWLVPTMPRALGRDRRWPFLVDHVVPSLHFGVGMKTAGEERMCVTVVDGDSAARQNHWFVEPADREGVGVALAGLLYKGTLTPA